VPVLTYVGPTFAGRLTASLLQAVGLPELATDSLPQYEELARRLASDPSRLQSIRRSLTENRSSHPLFDTDRFRRGLEAAYVTMWENWQRGDGPRSISVDPA
jgi:predicted O-linked N-acetylglucosamine transferase (SPINDLY family)